VTELVWDGSEKSLEHCEDGGALSGGLQIINSDSFHVRTNKYNTLKMR